MSIVSSRLFTVVGWPIGLQSLYTSHSNDFVQGTFSYGTVSISDASIISEIYHTLIINPWFYYQSVIKQDIIMFEFPCALSHTFLV